MNLCLGCDFTIIVPLNTEPFMFSIFWSHQYLGVQRYSNYFISNDSNFKSSHYFHLWWGEPAVTTSRSTPFFRNFLHKSCKERIFSKKGKICPLALDTKLIINQGASIFHFQPSKLSTLISLQANLSKKCNKAGLPTKPDDHRQKLTETIHIKLQFYPGWWSNERDRFKKKFPQNLNRFCGSQLIRNVKKLWTFPMGRLNPIPQLLGVFLANKDVLNPI